MNSKILKSKQKQDIKCSELNSVCRKHIKRAKFKWIFSLYLIKIEHFSWQGYTLFYLAQWTLWLKKKKKKIPVFAGWEIVSSLQVSNYICVVANETK